MSDPRRVRRGQLVSEGLTWGGERENPTPDPNDSHRIGGRVALLGRTGSRVPPPREATRVPHLTMGAASDGRTLRHGLPKDCYRLQHMLG